MNLFKKLLGKEPASGEDLSRLINYKNSEWNFSLMIPDNWEVSSENDLRNVPWVSPVRIMEPVTEGPRTSITILAQILAEDGSGLDPYMNNAEEQLRGYFKEFRLISKEQRTLLNFPAAWMSYTYQGGNGKIKELNVTAFFGSGNMLAFQFLCESDYARGKENTQLFEKMINNLKAGSAGIRLPFVELAGAYSCSQCGIEFSSEQEPNAMLNLESGLIGICNECKSKGAI